MKLIIQIPCFCEETTLPTTLSDLPRSIPGVDVIEVLVMDDGSSDRTAAVARELGVNHVISHKSNRGLAAAFTTALDEALRQGADIIVNTDGDNQYPGSEIARIVAPIADGEADIVIGDRQPATSPHYSSVKRRLHRWGTKVVSWLAGQPIPDPVSGFRAFSREAALQLTIVTSFSYTLESILHAAHKGLRLVFVPIRTNARTRDSRLFCSVFEFMFRSGITLSYVYLIYHVRTLLLRLGVVLMLVGSLPTVRFLLLAITGDSQGHIQSLVIGGCLFLTGCMSLSLGLLAALIALNRRMIEATLERVKRIDHTAATWQPLRKAACGSSLTHMNRPELQLHRAPDLGEVSGAIVHGEDSCR